MKNLTLIWVCLITFLSTSCSSGQFGKILKDVKKAVDLDELSTDEVALGLKEALNKGTSTGSDQLSAKGGYLNSVYKIFLPPDAKMIMDKLSIIPGFEKVEVTLIEKINSAAEDAAIKAKPIFLSAIKQMTIKDAWNILKGQDNAATEYLIRNTNQPLYNEFKPVIVESLNKFGALDYWSSAVSKYNKIPLVKQMNPDISDHITNKALEGLFKKIAEEELNIRHNLASRTSDLLKRVFSKQDK